ncbi:uncharacterized protein NPIL_423651 [Nephila pilipes]|uniref:Uncharacterized protein n=1 Tax=Nephila pilipes TaxID=299642 RepID=A0A8X6N2A0_NEPPI|nr:uncharacterized protein NPIL_423651 [Nephila pilipes]
MQMPISSHTLSLLTKQLFMFLDRLARHERSNYIMPPSSQNQKGAPVYAYRPGTTVQAQKFWPSRAHDGSMEQKPTLPKQQDSANYPENDGGTKKNG